jgi:hypothetical protein
MRLSGAHDDTGQPKVGKINPNGAMPASGIAGNAGCSVWPDAGQKWSDRPSAKCR